MHRGPITSVLASKDGLEVYTAGYDKAIYIWNRHTGSSELLDVHEHLINSLALSEDGYFLASASSDYTIRIYDLKTRRLNKTLFGHADDVESLSFAANDSLLISTSRDRRALVWNLATGAIQTEFHGHSKDVLSLWVNQNRAFTTGDDGRALIWDIVSGKEIGEIGPFDCELDAVSGNNHVNAFAIGADDGRVIIFNANTLHLQSSIQAHELGVKKVVFSPSGHYLLTAGYDHRIKIWNTSSCELVQELPPYKYQWERALAWTPDERSIVGASFGIRYCEWSLDSGELISPKWELATPSMNDLAISDHLEIATASDDGRFRLNGEELGIVNGTLTNGVGISNNGRFVVWGDHASEAHIVDRAENNCIYTVPLGTGPVNSICYCVEDRTFYIGTYGGYVYRLDPEQGQVKSIWKAHEGAVKSVAVDHKYVLTCSSDGSIHLFEKHDVSNYREFVGPHAIVNDIYLDSQNNRFVAVSRDKLVRLFDLQTGSILAQHNEHRYSIKSVTMTADGSVVSADYWGYVVIWNLETNVLIGPNRIVHNGISALRPYGDHVYACSYEGGVYRIDVTGNATEILRLFDQAAHEAIFLS